MPPKRGARAYEKTMESKHPLRGHELLTKHSGRGEPLLAMKQTMAAGSRARHGTTPREFANFAGRFVGAGCGGRAWETYASLPRLPVQPFPRGFRRARPLWTTGPGLGKQLAKQLAKQLV